MRTTAALQLLRTRLGEVQILVTSERPRLLRGSNLIRGLDVPAMIVNSELEAIACCRVRQPDTDRFVSWEAAGTTHLAAQTQVVRKV